MATQELIGSTRVNSNAETTRAHAAGRSVIISFNMIRHGRDGDFLLITQDDHARLSGDLARQIGNGPFPAPDNRVIEAIAMHDCGWPLHDEAPTLNTSGLPLHVFETPIQISTRVWRESARLAADVDPYVALLVSLHVLNLSAQIQHREPTPDEMYQHRHELFLLNQFQQDEIELQDEMRQQIGMRSDIPLRLGLATGAAASDAAEANLICHYALLRLMDRLSLELCCSESLPWKIDALPPAPGSAPINIQIEHHSREEVTVKPWIFSSERLKCRIPCRRVSGTPFADEKAFRTAYTQARREELLVQVHA